MRSLARRLAAAVAVVFACVALVAPVAPAHAATDPTASALDWLSHELAANNHQLGFKGAPGFTDWGLTIDFVLALAGGGRASAADTQATVSNVTANATSYVTDGAPGTTERYAGPMGKLLYMTKVFGVDSSNLGGLNIETELRALMRTSGGQTGRFSDASAFGDFSNGFGQAFDILGLARTSGGVPAEAITFLLAQQCPAGGFRLFYDSGDTCASDAEADPDATGLAIQALVGQTAASGAVSEAVTWLLGQQDASGAFRGSGPTASLNANSTGIIAQALRAAGQTAAANKAGVWIQSLQLTDTNAGAASADIGVIAYDPGQRDDAIAHGLPAERDPFRRATSQGVLALPQVTLPSGGGGGSGGGTSSGGITISTETAKPGDTVAVGGNGFNPNEPVRITLFSDPVILGTVNADANGLASFTFVVPANTPAGAHQVEMAGQISSKSLSIALQVTGSTTTTTSTTSTTVAGATTTAPGGGSATTAPTTAPSGSGELPRTGDDATRSLPIALLLIASGLGLVAVASRRFMHDLS
ncbi:MAG TPA: prenyltransferase/squalene oxidase repeat-containing protein [Acidimicrobiales bacterium]|nr:prenyltransferase/squalene oxidase repeat-containing protein [Acidimicrobiales bacterium]